MWTFAGIAGGFVYSPFVPVVIYHFYSVLRPQFMWEYSLTSYVSKEFPWSFLVAIAAIVTAMIWRGVFWFSPDRFKNVSLPRMNIGHIAFAFFALWITLSYYNARNMLVAEPVYADYRKIFLMFFITSIVMITVRQAWILYIVTALAIGYVGYEINEIYITSGGYNFIYKQGFCGLDNNGAALFLCMGIPLCMYAWDGINHWIRWLFPFLTLLIIHSILMSYSRGAMLSSMLPAPLYFLRMKHTKQISIMAMIGLMLLPVMAGKEIVERFSSISEHKNDESANSRKTTWGIAWRMAQENPLLGLGVRNSPLFTYQYGADEEGRVIHSTYLQIAADSGIVGLVAYAALILATLYCCRRVRHSISGTITSGAFLSGMMQLFAGQNWQIERTRGLTGPDAERAYTMACGVEGAMVSFAFGCMFLSLETFEPFYLLVLLATQLWAIIQIANRQQYSL